MRSFLLIRDEDVTGVSGTGIVAEGIEFSDGSVALKWLSEWPTSVVFHERGIESVQAIHGHNGSTRIQFALDFMEVQRVITKNNAPTCDRCGVSVTDGYYRKNTNGERHCYSCVRWLDEQ
jgi:hypothetical protein